MEKLFIGRIPPYFILFWDIHQVDKNEEKRLNNLKSG